MDATLPPESVAPPTPPPNYRDRKTGIIACGVILIVLGCLSALGIPFILLSAVMSRKATGTTLPPGSYVMAVVMYAAMAAQLIALGVGSVRVRRWARALTLIASSVWLAAGILMTVFFTALLPASFMEGFKRGAATNPNAPPPPMACMAVILTVMIVFFAMFLIVLPLVFLLFYRSNNVKETFNHRDPVERWTDRCPLPVLAMSLLFGLASPYYLLMSITTPLVPFFGRYLTGLPGAAGCLVLTALDAYLALALFRLRRTGWWIAVVSYVVRVASAAITYRHADLLQAYSRMGWKQTQLQGMEANPILPSVILWSSLVVMLLFLGYLVWLKRYFPAETVTMPPPSVEPPPSLTGPGDPGLSG